jgi:molybdopterin converting factor small subunit
VAVVTVRAFGALRELVGQHTLIEADHVAGLLALLAAEHGDEFRRRMTRATVIVGETTTGHDDTTPLQPGAEVVLLPPFAGGSNRAPARQRGG